MWSDIELAMKLGFSECCKHVGYNDHYLNKQLESAFTSETIDGEKVDCRIIKELFCDVNVIVTSAWQMLRATNAFYWINIV